MKVAIAARFFAERNMNINASHHGSFFIHYYNWVVLAIVFSFLILLWVKSELSVDAYQVNSNRLFQVYERGYYDHKIDRNYNTGPLLAS